MLLPDQLTSMREYIDRIVQERTYDVAGSTVPCGPILSLIRLSLDPEERQAWTREAYRAALVGMHVGRRLSDRKLCFINRAWGPQRPGRSSRPLILCDDGYLRTAPRARRLRDLIGGPSVQR